ncbi:ATPase, F1/V1/A1 complex, alpha/beta subunit, Zinc knuckle CX2CX4HX4C [Artemisia annua]|uniref:ATPase, F1/V1/A1 complex, alpha/beta subunit, Zinc knuckle CX2CX4HX4C n=1 Tax=Artemisia annua TaxID=35608 RepID=A0A2U1KNP4_ARTAN|nr:ATPase, F1/V1/A1 complex, alpha/beta subunit, Zinc knuckle CX2CX4HX4C [Artemisia annua]
MENNIRSSQRNVRPPARYGDSFLSQNKRNGNKDKEKGDNQAKKKGGNGSSKGDKREIEEVRNMEKENSFDGDLNGDSFPVIQSQVNKSKPTDVNPNCDIDVNEQLNSDNSVSGASVKCVSQNACDKNGEISDTHENVRSNVNDMNECKPLIMDEVTTNVCKTGMGRLGFAGVLVEISAKKQFKDVIEIAYRKKDSSTRMVKYVQVEYDWKPTRCNHCCVFRHDEVNCRMIPRETDKEKPNTEINEGNDGFQKGEELS